jgi:hypothetical protein
MSHAPQRIYQNPAFIPEQDFYFGIPFLSGIHLTNANPFTYHDILTKDKNDSISLEIGNLIDKISRNDHLRLYTNLDIFSFGFKIAQERFSLNFSLRERVSQDLFIPENLCYLIWYGNTAPQIYGKHVNISPKVNVSVYSEFGFTFSGYAIENKLSYGVRLKYLAGRFNITTKKSVFDLFTDTSNSNILLKSDIEIQTSGIDNLDNYLDQNLASLLFSVNRGIAIDLGLNYKINEKFNVNASVLDLGFIKWRSRTLSFVSQEPGKEFEFKGYKLREFMNLLYDFDSLGNELKDSISDYLQIDSLYNVKYKSNLPIRFNIGGTYSISNQHHFNLLLNGILWNHHIFPALSVSYYYNLRRFLGFMISYNIFNNQYTNFGGGISINGGPIHFYIVSDNIPGLIFYKNTNNISLQFGFNIFLHWKESPGNPMDGNNQPSNNGTLE